MHPFLRATIFVHSMYSTNLDQGWRMKKAQLPQKICPVCQRPFSWRKRWRKDWAEVKYCSAACRAKKLHKS
ncbi:DUF2256 domain-containing protein [Candidatus Igneacidithiobacillus taiwanensis]|uniref:DUF2256 domain-containing protein n=1 Tax=Candidatus Igneacidithiobacillus taiwanensis TaxID=1945924 RepID=UPI00289F0160|nr:DUF2256 domain-containing protein [Candidatus Igneacidithiobacillus taiwanensis]